MNYKLPALKSCESLLSRIKFSFQQFRKRYGDAAVIRVVLVIALLFGATSFAHRTVSPMISSSSPLKPLTEIKNSKEVFGFAPYWNIDKMASVDFKVLTTLAYFGVEVSGDGSINKDDPGYQTFTGDKATNLFRKAHANNTRVVLTLTQMDNYQITQLLDDDYAQDQAIASAVDLVRKRGIDGINVDMEYNGDPGPYYRERFTGFVAKLTDKMHSEVPNSSVSVSVYATSVKDPKLYDIAALGRLDIKIFMMAYDFATAGSDNAIPTAPLNGHENGKYWYDIATAVGDFLGQINPAKLILGVPYYGYNYMVYEPSVKAETLSSYSWRGQAVSQTYSDVTDNLTPNMEGVDQMIKGWDEDGKVGYIAYHRTDTDTWRMIFMEDSKSLSLKYDFAKSKDLAGVGIWALGNDNGKNELWSLLEDKFGSKTLADKVQNREVYDIYN